MAVCLPAQRFSHPQVTPLSLPLCSAMAFTIALSFVLEVLNVYCMVPLIWLANLIYLIKWADSCFMNFYTHTHHSTTRRSVLNLPLFMLFHVFIAVSSKCTRVHCSHTLTRPQCTTYRYLVVVAKRRIQKSGPKIHYCETLPHNLTQTKVASPLTSPPPLSPPHSHTPHTHTTHTHTHTRTYTHT